MQSFQRIIETNLRHSYDQPVLSWPEQAERFLHSCKPIPAYTTLVELWLLPIFMMAVGLIFYAGTALALGSGVLHVLGLERTRPLHRVLGDLFLIAWCVATLVPVGVASASLLLLLLSQLLLMRCLGLEEAVTVAIDELGRPNMRVYS